MRTLLLFVVACYAFGCGSHIETTTLPEGSVGEDYYAEVEANWSMITEWFVESDLPPGLEFFGKGNSATIEGIPTEPGSYYLILTVKSANVGSSATSSRAFEIEILGE